MEAFEPDDPLFGDKDCWDMDMGHSAAWPSELNRFPRCPSTRELHKNGSLDSSVTAAGGPPVPAAAPAASTLEPACSAGWPSTSSGWPRPGGSLAALGSSSALSLMPLVSSGGMECTSAAMSTGEDVWARSTSAIEGDPGTFEQLQMPEPVDGAGRRLNPVLPAQAAASDTAGESGEAFGSSTPLLVLPQMGGSGLEGLVLPMERLEPPPPQLQLQFQLQLPQLELQLPQPGLSQLQLQPELPQLQLQPELPQPQCAEDGEEGERKAPKHKLFTASSRKQLTSKYRGVCWNKKNKRWQAAINSSGKYLYLGSFTNEDDAARAFDRTAIKLRGRKAKTNFPAKDYVDADGNLREDLAPAQPASNSAGADAAAAAAPPAGSGGAGRSGKASRGSSRGTGAASSDGGGGGASTSASANGRALVTSVSIPDFRFGPFAPAGPGQASQAWPWPQAQAQPALQPAGLDSLPPAVELPGFSLDRTGSFAPEGGRGSAAPPPQQPPVAITSWERALPRGCGLELLLPSRLGGRLFGLVYNVAATGQVSCGVWTGHRLHDFGPHAGVADAKHTVASALALLELDLAGLDPPAVEPAGFTLAQLQQAQQRAELLRLRQQHMDQERRAWELQLQALHLAQASQQEAQGQRLGSSSSQQAGSWADSLVQQLTAPGAPPREGQLRQRAGAASGQGIGSALGAAACADPTSLDALARQQSTSSQATTAPRQLAAHSSSSGLERSGGSMHLMTRLASCDLAQALQLVQQAAAEQGIPDLAVALKGASTTGSGSTAAAAAAAVAAAAAGAAAAAAAPAELARAGSSSAATVGTEAEGERLGGMLSVATVAVRLAGTPGGGQAPPQHTKLPRSIALSTEAADDAAPPAKRARLPCDVAEAASSGCTHSTC